MPGGNTSSSKHGYRNYQGSSVLSNDIKHLNAAEWSADLKVDTPGTEPYEPDINYGLPLSGDIPSDTSGETQGNQGWTKDNPGPGRTNRGAEKVAGSKNPFPGGGW